MIKDFIRSVCQKLLGFDNYLFVFSLVNSQRIRAGNYEKEFRYFMHMLPDEGAILDIGANIGIMTVALAKHKRLSTIHSFEPIPNNLRALERVIRFYKLKNVRVFPIALGEEDSMVKMLLPVAKKSKMQGLSHIVMPGQTHQPGEIFSVNLKKMDDIPELHAIKRLTGIKMDVENFELYVLKGGEVLIKKHLPVIYCELWDNDMRQLCFDLLSKFGYRAMIYQHGRLVDFTGQVAINFFFLPQVIHSTNVL